MSDRKADHQNGTPDRSRPTREQAYALLGLAPGARTKDVRAAFRRLAFEHHPDRNPDDPSRHEHFARIANAYRVLAGRKSAKNEDEGEGHCVRCGEYGALVPALDNTLCCLACLRSVNGGRILPGPPIVMATCGLAMTILMVGAVLLLVSVGKGDSRLLVAAFLCGAAGLLALTVTAVSIAYVARPRRR